MLRNTKSLFTAALSTALLFFAAAPAQAQAGLVTLGHGTFQAFTQPNTIGFSFFVWERPNGTTDGLASFSGFGGPGSAIIWRVTSHVHTGTSQEVFAGEVVLQIGGGQQLPIGTTVFSAVNDNGHGAPDDIASLSVLPPSYGNLTAQQIVGLIGPPMPANFTSVLHGNIWVR